MSPFIKKEKTYVQKGGGETIKTYENTGFFEQIPSFLRVIRYNHKQITDASLLKRNRERDLLTAALL